MFLCEKRINTLPQIHLQIHNTENDIHTSKTYHDYVYNVVVYLIETCTHVLYGLLHNEHGST